MKRNPIAEALGIPAEHRNWEQGDYLIQYHPGREGIIETLYIQRIISRMPGPDGMLPVSRAWSVCAHDKNAGQRAKHKLASLK